MNRIILLNVAVVFVCMLVADTISEKKYDSSLLYAYGLGIFLSGVGILVLSYMFGVPALGLLYGIYPDIGSISESLIFGLASAIFGLCLLVLFFIFREK